MARKVKRKYSDKSSHYSRKSKKQRKQRKTIKRVKRLFKDKGGVYIISNGKKKYVTTSKKRPYKKRVTYTRTIKKKEQPLTVEDIKKFLTAPRLESSGSSLMAPQDQTLPVQKPAIPQTVSTALVPYTPKLINQLDPMRAIEAQKDQTKFQEQIKSKLEKKLKKLKKKLLNLLLKTR